MADVTSYCSKTDVQTLIGAFTIPDAWSDALVTDSIARQSERINGLTGCFFGLKEITLVVDGSGGEFLRLLNYTDWPMVSITDVYYREAYANADDFESDGTLQSTDKFRISRSKHSLQRIVAQDLRGLANTDPVWIRGVGNYRVKGMFGYNEIPKSIEAACVLLVREEMTPGTLAAMEFMESERWPDGYSYTKGKATQAATPSLPVSSGSALIDSWLSGFFSQVHDVAGIIH